MSGYACFTVDVEPDCLPYLGTFRGITEGLPALLALLAAEDVRGTFFTTGRVAEDFPDDVDAIVRHGHEVGSHGHTHRDFTAMDGETASQEIRQSVDTLRAFAPVHSFRAPYLRFPDRHLPLLAEAGLRIDSSQARYKRSYYRRPSVRPAGLMRVPASVTSSALRLPHWIRNPLLHCLPSPLVLFVHPWEFVDLTGETLRYDCRFKTGLPALRAIRSVLRHLKRHNVQFVPIQELPTVAPARYQPSRYLLDGVGR